METIKHDGKIISIIYRDDDWIEGLNFITPNELFVQAGSWWYQKGEILQNHIHTDYVRQGTRTQETVYVKKGSMRCLIFSEKKEYLQDFILYEEISQCSHSVAMVLKFLRMIPRLLNPKMDLLLVLKKIK